MATSINRLVASRVFHNHPVSKGVFVTVYLLRVAKRPSSVATEFFRIDDGRFDPKVWSGEKRG